MTERYITHHVTDHCAIQGPESEVLAQVSRKPAGDLIERMERISLYQFASRDMLIHDCALGHITLGDIADLCTAIRALPATPAGDLVSREAVADAMEDDKGRWITCSGCHDTEDGHPTQHYAYSDALQCALGNGCFECGGLGAIWDTTDYDELAEWMENEGREANAAPLAFISESVLRSLTDGGSGCYDMASPRVAPGRPNLTVPLYTRTLPAHHIGEVNKMAAPAVKVRPLVWHGPDCNGDFHANSTLEVYRINATDGHGYWVNGVGGYYQQIEEAKAATQAKHNARILATLEGGDS